MDYVETFIQTFPSEHTQKNYKNDITSMLEFVGKPQEEIRRIDLIQWKTTLQRYSTATQARKISAIKSYFDFLEENELVTVNPAAKLSRPRIQNKPQDFITKKEVLRMIEVSTNPREKAIIALYLSTGMRVQELIDIQLEDYENNPDQLVFKTKGGKYRKATLNKDCQKYINQYLKVRKDGVSNLFVNNQCHEMKPRDISNSIKKLAKRIGYEGKISNHTLRSTFITDIAMNHGIVVAQAMVQHSNINTTQRYVRGIESQAQEIMSTIDLT